jgi:diguanylate cyclase (GGDEF)-like protein
MRYGLALSFNLAGSRYVHRLGRSHEYAMTNTVMALMAAGLGMSRRAQRLSRQAAELATELGDPQVSAFIAWMHEYAENAGGAANIARWADVAERTRPWLEADLYLHTIRLRAYDLVLRGYGDEALSWIERAQSRVADPHDEQYFRITLTEAAARSLLGQEVDPPSVVARLGESGLEPGQAAQIAICALPLLLEQDELGEPFDTVIGEFDRLQIPPLALHREDRLIFVAEVFGRLTRCQRAAEPQRAALVAAATKAERRLGRLANSPLLRGYHRVAKASLSQLSGEPAAALSLLAAADKHVVRLDAPLVHFEAARVRARALRALGEDALWRQHADQAFALAARHGWSRRQRSVRAEFGVANATRTGGRTRQSDSVGNRYRRRLEALQQVSAAAATVIDPHQVARVALDETLRILGAERAILFLCDDDGRPRPSLGRTGAGELTELTGYSASLVERVAADRTSLVVTGSEEGAALGSRSAVVHGLRSIMMAPLELDGQLLGVLYLDSRVAKGVFTDEDIDILTAVTNQVAVSLKTAQAAQLEVAVQTARQQRDTAEALREAMNELAATLDPEQVLHGLRDITARTLSTDRVCLLHRDGDALTVATGGDPEPDVAIDIAALAAIGPRIGDGASIPSALAPMCDGVDGWLMTPLTTRGHGVGVLVAWSSTADGFSQAELDIASALAGQGATAYANARLFAQVQLLATTDGLTGIFNRRHFSDLATRQLDIAVRNNRPMAAMMIDIDHFKRINDTCGHGIGDDVIREVAGVLQANLREPDVLCRYGGEEFAVVLSEMHGDPMTVAERLRETVESLAIPGPAGAVRPTVSIGVVDLKPDDQLEWLLARADEALYRAKAAGRDCVCAAASVVSA